MTESLLTQDHDILTVYKPRRSLGMDFEDHETHQNSPALLNQSEGYNLMKLERAAKDAVTLNKLKMILILKSILLIGVAVTFIDHKWFLMAETENYDYWVNFLFIGKVCRSGASAQACQTSQSVYSTSLMSFYNSGCLYESFTSDDPSDLCSIVARYYYSGLVTFVIIILGLFVHFLHLIQLGQIWKTGSSDTVKWLNPKKVPYFTVFLYLTSMLVWFFASSAFMNENTTNHISLFQRLGRSFVWYIVAIFVFVITTVWCHKLLSLGKHRNMVNSLLNAEIKYIEDLHGANQQIL